MDGNVVEGDPGSKVIVEKLEFRHRTLWLYVSAGVLAASLLIAFVFSIWEYYGEKGRQTQLAANKGQVVKRLNDLLKEYGLK